MEKIYGMHKLVGLQLFWSRTPFFSSGTPTFCQMGVLNSCFQNPNESSVFWVFSILKKLIEYFLKQFLSKFTASLNSEHNVNKLKSKQT